MILPRTPHGHPYPPGDLAADLAALGLRRDRDVIVHCSMRRLGWIDGGAEAVLTAVQDAAGPRATIVVPTFTTIKSPTSRVYRRAVADAVAKGMTPEEAARYVLAEGEPTPETGRLARALADRPGAVRSGHPLTSFAAIGPHADRYMSGHEVAVHLGASSPIAKLYDADASILLLGVGYEACTALHLAEYRLARTPPARRYTYLSGGREDGGGEFTGIPLDDGDFPRLGDELDRQPFVRTGRVAAGTGRTMTMKDTVDFAVRWMTLHRGSEPR